MIKTSLLGEAPAPESPGGGGTRAAKIPKKQEVVVNPSPTSQLQAGPSCKLRFAIDIEEVIMGEAIPLIDDG